MRHALISPAKVGLFISPGSGLRLATAFFGLLSMAFSGAARASDATDVDSSYRPEPIFSRYAQINDTPVLNLAVEYFHHKPMEEMDSFDGYTLTLDVTYPINDVSQIELLLPLYTAGEGEYDKPGEPFDGQTLDVKGFGGVREFASLIYERQVFWVKSRPDIHLSWQVGFGYRLDPLDAEKSGELVDKFNHKGHSFQLGLKADSDIRDRGMTLVGNLRYVIFRDTDDINLSGDSVNFQVLYATGAILFNNLGRLTPALEILIEEDFRNYTSVRLSPGAIYTLSEHIDIKLSAPFRVTNDGEKYTGELELSYRF